MIPLFNFFLKTSCFLKKIEHGHVGEYIKMGQYYYPIILDANGKIVMWMNGQTYNEGLKLMEHAYLRNSFVNTFEFALSPEGPHYKSRVVWAGDGLEKICQV